MVEPWDDEERFMFCHVVIPVEAGTQEPSWLATRILNCFPGDPGPGLPPRGVRGDKKRWTVAITPDPRR